MKINPMLTFLSDLQKSNLKAYYGYESHASLIIHSMTREEVNADLAIKEYILKINNWIRDIIPGRNQLDNKTGVMFVIDNAQFYLVLVDNIYYICSGIIHTGTAYLVDKPKDIFDVISVGDGEEAIYNIGDLGFVKRSDVINVYRRSATIHGADDDSEHVFFNEAKAKDAMDELWQQYKEEIS